MYEKLYSRFVQVRLQNQAATASCSSSGTVVGLLQNGPFAAVALPVHNAQHRDTGESKGIVGYHYIIFTIQ